MTKQKWFPAMILMAATFLLSGCNVVGGIFKAGMWWAFFLVALVIVLVLWIVAKTRKK